MEPAQAQENAVNQRNDRFRRSKLEGRNVVPQRGDVNDDQTAPLYAGSTGKILLSGREMAARLGVSHRTLEKMVSTGVCPALRLSPRMLRFEEAAVLAALRKYQTATLK